MQAGRQKQTQAALGRGTEGAGEYPRFDVTFSAEREKDHRGVVTRITSVVLAHGGRNIHQFASGLANNVVSLHCGPYLLAGLSNGSFALQADVADIDSWLTLDASSTGAAHELSLTAKSTTATGGEFKLLPLNRIADQRYTAHFNVSKMPNKQRVQTR